MKLLSALILLSLLLATPHVACGQGVANDLEAELTEVESDLRGLRQEQRVAADRRKSAHQKLAGLENFAASRPDDPVLERSLRAAEDELKRATRQLQAVQADLRGTLNARQELLAMRARLRTPDQPPPAEAPSPVERDLGLRQEALAGLRENLATLEEARDEYLRLAGIETELHARLGKVLLAKQNLADLAAETGGTTDGHRYYREWLDAETWALDERLAQVEAARDRVGEAFHAVADGTIEIEASLIELSPDPEDRPEALRLAFDADRVTTETLPSGTTRHTITRDQDTYWIEVHDLQTTEAAEQWVATQTRQGPSAQWNARVVAVESSTRLTPESARKLLDLVWSAVGVPPKATRQAVPGTAAAKRPAPRKTPGILGRLSGN